MRRGKVEKVSFEYDRAEMTRLYNELGGLFRYLGVDMAAERGKHDLPFLYSMYDDLYEAGASS